MKPSGLSEVIPSSCIEAANKTVKDIVSPVFINQCLKCQ